MQTTLRSADCKSPTEDYRKKGKSATRDFRERDLSSLFKRINPEEVDNIDEYNTIANH